MVFKRKILLIVSMPPAINGQAVYTSLLLKLFDRKNINYYCFPISDYMGKIDSKFIFSIRVYKYFILLFRFLFFSLLGKKIIYLSPGRTKLGFSRDLPIIFWSWILGHKIILHFHAGDFDIFFKNQSKTMKNLIIMTYSKVNAIITLSEKLRQSVTISPSLSNKVHIIPNGINISHKQAELIKTIDKDKQINILFLSNLIESKGYLTLIEAVYILINDFNLNISCSFCGAFIKSDDDILLSNVNSPELFFKNKVNELNLSNHIHYLGLINGDNKHEILKSSHFFVLPTNYNAEAQPISILEAMSYGIVVISTNYRAISDMVLDSSTGFIVPYNSPMEIARKIKFTVENPKFYETMSKNSFLHIKQNFSLDENHEKVLSLLKSLDDN